MNNDFLHMKSNIHRKITTLTTDQSLIHNINQNTSLDLTDISILSVGLNHTHGMLTDDDEVVGINRKIIFNHMYIYDYF
jgi:hypothetical protein